MASYTASLWTKITSSANVPPFDTNVYTLKATIDDTTHTLPGNPYLYPTNLSVGQNLYTVFTAPSGAHEIPLLCVSTSFEQDDIIVPNCPGNNPWIIRTNLFSGSCDSSGSANWNGGSPLYVYVIGVDNQNGYYYENTVINNGQNTAYTCVDVAYGRYLVSVQIDIISGQGVDYEVIECGNCGQPNQVYYDNNYAVVVPASLTSSTFPAEMIVISGSNYAVKVSSSIDGQIANVDVAIGWNTGSNTPIYYTASFGSVYYSTAISASVQRNDCPSGEDGSFVLYTLPASQSSATSSQQDAQDLAQAYFNSNSQSYANTYGTCTPTGSTLTLYAKYTQSEASLEYRINGSGSFISLGVVDWVNCDSTQWPVSMPITGFNNGDMWELQSPDGIISVSTTTCPSSANQCADYGYLSGGANTLYVTVNGSIIC